MAWTNSPIRLFHGTDDVSSDQITAKGVDLRLCKPLTDFGAGFYTTTNLEQAKNWANKQAIRLRLGGRVAAKPAVIEFRVARSGLAGLKSLTFVREDKDFWAFVTYCRKGGRLHGRGGTLYDVVSGPVSIWPQPFVISDCDQFSFHTHTAVMVMGPASDILSVPTKGSGLFRVLR